MRDGWAETTLDGIAEYINGYPFKPADLGEVGLPVIRIKQLLDPTEPVDRTNTDTPDRCLLRDGDIVFSWSGTLAVRIWNRGPAKLNQHLFRVVEKKGVYKGIIPLILEHAIEELEEKYDENGHDYLLDTFCEPEDFFTIYHGELNVEDVTQEYVK